jgi:hypothetical protein
MTARVLVADRVGRILAELEPELGPVSWRLNGVGKLTLSLARTDPKATEANLRFGNRMLVQFDNGLPNWGGVIDPPRDWDGLHVDVTAYSGEHLLGMRQTDRGRYFTQATVGYMFQQLILEANAVFAMGIMVGSVWTGGELHSPDLHFKNLLAFAQDSLCRRLESADIAIVAGESAGNITFTAYLWERRGMDKPGVVLLEGHNLATVKLSEQGTIVNSWDLAGEGTTWGEDRLMSHAQDADSIDEFGFRQDSAVYSDTSNQVTLDGTAASLLAESAQPHNILTLEAADLAPAAFADYDVGDSVRAMLHSYGFGGYDHVVRLLTREYDPAAGTCGLVVQEDD